MATFHLIARTRPLSNFFCFVSFVKDDLFRVSAFLHLRGGREVLVNADIALGSWPVLFVQDEMFVDRIISC